MTTPAERDEFPTWLQVLEGTFVAVTGQFMHAILSLLFAMATIDTTGNMRRYDWIRAQEHLHWMLMSPGLTQLLWVPLAAWYLVHAGRRKSAITLVTLAGCVLLYNLIRWEAWHGSP